MITNAGTVRFGLFASVPIGWVAMTGQSVSSTTYPNLAAAWGKSGSFTIPDMGDATAIGPGGTIGSTGGNSSVSLSSSNLPSHTHSISGGGSHTHSMTHTHGLESHSHSGGSLVSSVSGPNTAQTGTTGWRSFAGFGSVGSPSGFGGANGPSNSNTGSAGSGATVTGSTGGGSSFNIQSPYVVCRAIVKI